jgi:rare lipoprotein A
MNTLLIRHCGTVFAALALAGCATNPAPGDRVSPTLGSAHDSSTLAAHRGQGSLTDPQGLWASPGAPTAFSPADQAATADSAKSESQGTLAAASPIRANAPDVSNFEQRGSASWYGSDFHGRRTASGERFDMNALTAAHRTLPLASYVRVTNIKNQKSVIVRINDRGPFHRGRIIDLSKAAAKALGMQHAGTTRVDIHGLSAQEAKVERDEMLASNK